MADSQNKIQEIQNSYQNAETEKYFLCCTRKVAKSSAKRNIYAGVPDLKVDDNTIETSKYNYFTFLPKNLIVQFSKLANIYFIIVGICQIIPQISNTDGKPIVYTPLAIVIFISMIKDFVEDRRRRKQDEKENKSETLKLNTDNGQFEKAEWQSLRIGDIIKIKENQRFPADILILSTSGKKGTCYIETKNLDGETNLKHRQSCSPAIFQNEDIFSDKNFIGSFEFNYEEPNHHIHRFNGIMKVNEQTILNVNNICLRGCSLKKTHYITGIVVYSGHDCKSLKYSNNPRYKFGTVESIMNRMVVYVFLILVAIAIFSSAYYVIWYSIKQDQLPYLHIDDDDYESKPVANFFLRIPMWILILNTFVPISLLVTLEIVKYLQGLIISSDKNFTNSLSDELVEVNSSNLIDQLGQIKYILTDKTGTLTGNVMKFKAISLNGISYEHTQYDDNGVLRDDKLIEKLKDPKANPLEYEVFMCMNLCHELIIEEQDGKMVHTGTSADEEAIMEFCVETGIYFESVDENKIMKINDKINNQILEFKIISLHEYRSDLRKMSVLVQNLQTKEYRLYQKGSMSTIFDSLRDDQQNQMQTVKEHLDKFATDMLRTLCMSYRELSEQEVQSFQQKQHQEISKGGLNIQEMNDKIFAEIENQQVLLGGTGVNDEFGDQVVPTLINLKKAGIKIWMITGDKRETALSIGVKCGIVDKDVQLKVIEEYEENPDDDNIILQQVNEIAKLMENNKLSIGLSGGVFTHLHSCKNQTIANQFGKVMKKAESVVAFHFTPMQKQQLVELVHKISPGQSVLSIGDGANDVRMLQIADVGIGIRGKEGREAAKASDFSIAEFKHLNRLLLYIGQESYRKNGYLILFNFYKNQAWNLVQFWFNFYSGMSAQYIYDQWVTQFFNVFYVSLPIILYALFDERYPSGKYITVKHTKPNLLEKLPLEYKRFTNHLFFNRWTFWKWFIHGGIHGLIIMCISFYSVGNFSHRYGRQNNIYFQGMHAFTCCVILGNLKVQQLHRTHYFITLFFIYGSIGFYISSLQIASNITALDSFGLINALFSQANTYFGIMIMILLTFGLDSAYEIYFYRQPKTITKRESRLSQIEMSINSKRQSRQIQQNNSEQTNTKHPSDENMKKSNENSTGEQNQNFMDFPQKSKKNESNHQRLPIQRYEEKQNSQNYTSQFSNIGQNKEPS